MKGIATMTLIILVAIVVIALSTAIFGTYYNSLSNSTALEEKAKEGFKTGSPGSIGSDTSIRSEPFKSNLLDHIITKPGEPYQPSEVACQIADTIFKDYTKNGIYVKEIRDNVPGACWDRGGLADFGIKKTCIVNNPEIFTLKEFTQDDLGTYGDSWELALNNSAKYGPCHLCEENGKAIPLLDETCVNMQFKDRQVGNTPFCNGEFSSLLNPISSTSAQQGTPVITFGNYNCYIPSYNTNSQTGSNDWASHCTDSSTNTNNFCYSQGKDLIYNWDKFDPYRVADCSLGSDYCTSVGNTPADDKTRVKDRFATNDPRGILDHDGRRYVFGVTWSEDWTTSFNPPKDNGKYNVFFARVPSLEILPQTSPEQSETNAIADKIDSYVERSSKIYRYNDLGLFSPYARRVADFLAWGDDSTTIPQIMAKIGDAANEKSDVTPPDPDNIFDADCSSSFITQNQREGTDASWGCVLWSICYDKTTCLETFPVKPLDVFSTRIYGSEDGNFGTIVERFLGCWRDTQGYDPTQNNWRKNGACSYDYSGNNELPSQGASIIVKSNMRGGINAQLQPHHLYRIVVNTWFDPTYNYQWPETSGTWYFSRYVRTVGIMDITDDYHNKQCCNANSMLFSITPNTINAGQPITPSVSNLSYCYKKDVYFYDSPCVGHHPGDNQQKSNCTINDQKALDDSLYCWTGEQYEPGTVGCTGNSFNVPDTDTAGNHNYYACVDTNNDGNFEKEVQASVTVSNPSCPDKCESGKEYRGGSGSPCTYASVKTCNYGCHDTVRCNQGKFCTADTSSASCGCRGGGWPCGSTCPKCSDCTGESNTPPICSWTKSDCVNFLCIPTCKQCSFPGFPSGCNCNGNCAGYNQCCTRQENNCQTSCSIDNAKCPTYSS